MRSTAQVWWRPVSGSSPSSASTAQVAQENYKWFCKARFRIRKRGIILPYMSSVKESTCQYRRHGFNPWASKFPWRRKWQSTLIFLAWKILTEEPGGPQSMGSQRVRHNWATEHSIKIPAEEKTGVTKKTHSLLLPLEFSVLLLWSLEAVETSTSSLNRSWQVTRKDAQNRSYESCNLHWEALKAPLGFVTNGLYLGPLPALVVKDLPDNAG